MAVVSIVRGSVLPGRMPEARAWLVEAATAFQKLFPDVVGRAAASMADLSVLTFTVEFADLAAFQSLQDRQLASPEWMAIFAKAQTAGFFASLTREQFQTF